MEYPYLLLDAGGTLVFPDQELMARTAAEEGSILDPERIYEAHYRLVYQYDVYLRENSSPPPVSLGDFFQLLLTQAGAPKDVAEHTVNKLVVRHETTSLWTYTKPWVVETLAELKQLGFRMSVISNSDGRVRQQLDACGITHYLEEVYDSQIVGVEKPDPRIFLHALTELDLAPENALYIGDMYHIDVLGANAAGIGAVHLDPLGCYDGWPGLHLRDIRDLPGWTATLGNTLSEYNLFPASAGYKNKS